MSSASNPPFAKAWLAQWNSASKALEALRARELRGLDGAKALAATELLLSMVDPSRTSLDRIRTSGLVEQQRLFLLRRGL